MFRAELDEEGEPVFRPLGPAGMDRPARLEVDLDRTETRESEIAIALEELAGDGYRRIDLNAAMLAGELQLQLVVLMQDGRQVVPEVNDADLLMRIRRALTELRAEFHRPGLGTWFQMRLMVNFPDSYSCSYDFRYEPEWNPPIDPEKYVEDFDAFPRSERFLPPWLRERLDQARPGGWTAAPEVAGLIPWLEQGYKGREILDRLSDLLGHRMPSGTGRLTIWHRALGDQGETEVDVLDIFGKEVDWSPPDEVFELLRLMRETVYEEGKGTWFTGRVWMENIAKLNLDWDDQGEPDWDVAPPRDACAEELRRFPRAPEFVPPWMARRLGEAEPRLARTNDGVIPLPRSSGFQVPEVDEATRAAAAAVVTRQASGTGGE